jgi:hypothetical protein
MRRFAGAFALGLCATDAVCLALPGPEPLLPRWVMVLGLFGLAGLGAAILQSRRPS